MDITAAIAIFFVIFLMFCICGACAKKKRNEGTVFSTPVVVTSTTHQVPVGGYPVTVAHGSIQSSYPVQVPPHATIIHNASPQQYGQSGPQYGNYQMPQPQPGYPPMPQPGGSQPPYPTQQTMPYPAQHQPVMHPGQFVAGPQFNPPSYDQVVGGGAGAGSQHQGFQKQAPFNPNFTG